MFGTQKKWTGPWLQQSREARWCQSAPLVCILKWVRKEGEAGAKGENFKVMRQSWWTLALTNALHPFQAHSWTFWCCLWQSASMEKKKGGAIMGSQQEATIPLWSSQGHTLAKPHMIQRCGCLIDPFFIFIFFYKTAWWLKWWNINDWKWGIQNERPKADLHQETQATS